MSANIKAIAISAPHWQMSPHGGRDRHLNSRIPFSLQNAIRIAADRAENGVGYWGNSNWNTFEGRQDSVFMTDYLDDTLRWLTPRLKRIRPHIIFIGSMTLSFPGAIEIARTAKQVLGSEVITILGGKHANETHFVENGELALHDGSPLKLMRDGKLDEVFDFVLSGDGEEVIRDFGEIIGTMLSGNIPLSALKTDPEFLQHVKPARGEWVLGWTVNREIRHMESTGENINYDELPVPAALFPIDSAFSVFNADLTAHTYSDTSKGCIYSCSFCSEGQAINGKLKQMSTAAWRLARQFKAVQDYGIAHNKKMSAFVEDSNILQGNSKSMLELCNILEREEINILFGGQLTSDMINQPKRFPVLKRMREVGFDYVFIGVETGDEEIASTMHKNLGASGAMKSQLALGNVCCKHGNHDNPITIFPEMKSAASWSNKNEKTFEILNEAGIQCGCSVLFGLGEPHIERINLLKRIRRWQSTHGSPVCVSLNWAVQHPLRMLDYDHRFDYLKWGSDPTSSRFNVMTEVFGEASEHYCIKGVEMASKEELEEIHALYLELNNDI